MTQSPVTAEAPRVNATFHIDGNRVVGTAGYIDDVNVFQNLPGDLRLEVNGRVIKSTVLA